MIALWFLGVLLSLAATLFGTLGKVCLKLAHSANNNWSIKLIATLCVFILNPCFDALSYAYAAQSILAPMAGFSVVWNIVLSPFILHEKLSKHDLKATLIILVGCAMVGISGSHETPNHPSSEIFALFVGAAFLRYTVIVFSTCCVLVYMICNLPRKSIWRRFAFGALSGLVGGNLYFLKASVELLAEGGDIWYHIETYLIFIGALGTAGGGIYILDLGLREYEALCVVSMYESFLILIGSVSGMIFFHETNEMATWWQALLYPVSIATTISGIMILSFRQVHASQGVTAEEYQLIQPTNGCVKDHGTISPSVHGSSCIAPKPFPDHSVASSSSSAASSELVNSIV